MATPTGLCRLLSGTVVRKLYGDGRVEEVAERMTLAQMHLFVGGEIGCIATTLPHRALLVGKTALLHDPLPPLNHAATRLVRPGTPLMDGIRGNALLVTEDPCST